MDIITLEAHPREQTQKANAVRNAGRIPAVYYGAGVKSHTLALDYKLFRKVFDKAGENTIIELSLAGKKTPVLVHDIQFDPVSDQITHVDFIHVDMNKEVTTSVRVNFIGVAPAIKNLGGILDVQKHEIKIKCLPKDLIHSIDVDVTSIVDFHTSIHVKDIQLPSHIKILDKPEDTVVTAVPPRAEEVAAPAPAAPAEGAVAGAAPAEGAAPAAGAPAAGAAAPAASAKEAKK